MKKNIETSNNNTSAILELNVDDLILGMDQVINYQPAGSGSIENCRPMRKSGNVLDQSTTTTTNVPINASSISNHQHRLNVIKKHSSLYQN